MKFVRVIPKYNHLWAVKLSRTMQEREHTALELEKLNRCKAFLKANGVFDQDSFVELTNEE